MVLRNSTPKNAEKYWQKQYKVFYREYHIGTLYVELDTQKHCYVPVSDSIERIKDTVPLIPEMCDGTNGYVDPIPFFQNRLMNMYRNGLKEINYQTDYFLIKEEA